MNGCYIKARNPNESNIRYTVAEKPVDLLIVVKPIVKHVIEKGQEADRCIIFCRTYKDSATLFELIILELESSGVLITSTESGQTLRICEKFTACSSPNTKGKIIAPFTHPNGILRIVVATVAFGMGLDSPNVRTVIHWGPPEDQCMCRKLVVVVVTMYCLMPFSTITSEISLLTVMQLKRSSDTVKT